MKDDFAKAVEQANLYAQHAMVVTLSFGATDAAPDTAETGRQFLAYLQDSNTPHEVLLVNSDNLSFVLPREEEEGEKKARATVAGFFNGQMRPALRSEAYYQDTAANTAPANTGPANTGQTTPLAREIAKKAARLNSK